MIIVRWGLLEKPYSWILSMVSLCKLTSVKSEQSYSLHATVLSVSAQRGWQQKPTHPLLLVTVRVWWPTFLLKSLNLHDIRQWKKHIKISSINIPTGVNLPCGLKNPVIQKRLGLPWKTHEKNCAFLSSSSVNQNPIVELCQENRIQRFGTRASNKLSKASRRFCRKVQQTGNGLAKSEVCKHRILSMSWNTGIKLAI